LEGVKISVNENEKGIKKLFIILDTLTLIGNDLPNVSATCALI